MKYLIYAIFAILYILVSLFGMGPVLLADGSIHERLLTFMLVLAIYALLTLVLKFFIKRSNK